MRHLHNAHHTDPDAWQERRELFLKSFFSSSIRTFTFVFCLLSGTLGSPPWPSVKSNCRISSPRLEKIAQASGDRGHGGSSALKSAVLKDFAGEARHYRPYIFGSFPTSTATQHVVLTAGGFSPGEMSLPV